MNTKSIIALSLFVLCFLGALLITPQLYENVKAGTYDIAQSPFTGKMTAYMQPGPFFQCFADVTPFPVSETFYFTKDVEGGSEDTSMKVQFNDGSMCSISGTCRIDLPKSEEEAINLITKFGYRDMDQLERKLISQVIRRALVMSANQMSAKESYAERRANFIADAWDQIDNGVYLTKDQVVKEMDVASGQMVTRIHKIPVVDANGVKIREHNPLKGTGIVLSNFVVKDFVYEEKVRAQISTQQQALMDVQTARANALKSEQDALTEEAKGKANVMKAKYEREQDKVKATVDAEKEQAVAIIKAQQLVEVANKEKEQALIAANRGKEVAMVDLESAKLSKQQTITLAEGQAEAKRLILASDGALAQKLEALVQINKDWASAFKDRKVPSVIMGQKESTNSDTDAQTFMQILGVKAAKDLSVDTTINAK